MTPQQGEPNIIDGEECCYRCGLSSSDVRKHKFKCNVYGTVYDTHMWHQHMSKGASDLLEQEHTCHDHSDFWDKHWSGKQELSDNNNGL